MSKHYSSKALAFLFRCFAICVLFFQVVSTYSQGLACNAGVNVSLDENCEAVIDATYILKGEPDTADPTDYIVTITTHDGKTPDSLLIMSSSTEGGPFTFSNSGEYIKFDQVGNYKVSVLRKGTNPAQQITCWGYIRIEDKLLPFTESCACPETAEVVPELCRFTCASVTDFMKNDSIARSRGVNPVFRDNCGNLGGIEFDDELVRDTICGNWIILRTWRTLVEDAKGKLEYKDLGCTQKFLFESVGVDAVFPPKKKLIVECGTDTEPQSLRDYFSNTTLFPSATLDSGICAAFPFLRDSISMDSIILHEVGLGLSPGSQDDLCKLTATYTDQTPIRICGDIGYKFVRRWDVLDWCDNESREFHQVIKVEDNTDPYFEIPDTIPAGMTDPWTCEGDIMVPAPDSLSDNCSSISQLTYIAYVLNGTNRIEANAANDYKLSGIKPGMYDVIYVVTDLCGNEAIRQAKLIVEDGVKPVALSKHEIVVTFTSFDGECKAKVFPQNIDAGSFDACSDDITLEIRRKGEGTYRQFVKFTQDDITDVNPAGVAFGIVNVEMRVTDPDGNFNITWTRVRLEDKNARLSITCGDRNISLNCEEDLDQAIEDAKPTAVISACQDRPLDVVGTIRDSSFHEGCLTGTVIVDYKIEGGSDTICTKTFVIGDIDSLIIQFPPQEIERSCSDTNYGDVIISQDKCNKLAITEEIRDFDITGGSGYCKKLVREIVVIDWCLYRPNTGDSIGIYTFQQVIKIRDNSAPVLTCTNVSLTAGDNCSVDGFQLTASVSDDAGCDDNSLIYTAAIDTDNDGTYDLVLSPVETADGELMAIVGSPLSVGTYKVRWTATDDCNNTGETICTINITDEKAPTPQCISVVSTATMNTDGSVGIWAVDFDLDKNTTDDCGGDVTYSFSGTDRNVPSMTFSCSDLSNGVSEVLDLRVYVWDESGNVDFCNVQLRIDDNSDTCPDENTGMALIGGTITTPSGDVVESAEVSVKSWSTAASEKKMTDINGEYAFANNPLENEYEVIATKSDDYLNGLSTLDIILMQRHILNVAPFENAHQVIASDVNLDERVTALDLVEMRRLLLGTKDAFSGNQSWMFISSDQTFENVLQPWPLQEDIHIDILDKNMREENFTAIKLGDVNGNAIANSAILGEGRSTTTLPMLAEDREVRAGQEVTLNFDLTKLYETYGLQMSLALESGRWKHASASTLSLTEEHVAIVDDQLNISWSDLTAVSQGGFLQVSFTATKAGKLSDMITLNTDHTEAQAYTGDNLDIINVDLAWTTKSDITSEFEVYQNAPNPWGPSTTIGFQIAKAGQVNLAVFDITGRQVAGTSAFFEAGYNEFQLSQDDIKEAGLLYYQLSHENKVVTKKMIAID